MLAVSQDMAKAGFSFAEKGPIGEILWIKLRGVGVSPSIQLREFLRCLLVSRSKEKAQRHEVKLKLQS